MKKINKKFIQRYNKPSEVLKKHLLYESQKELKIFLQTFFTGSKL